MSSSCRIITEDIREKVAKPVEKFTKEWKKECERHRKEIEKNVKKPVEKWVEKVEKECDDWFILFKWLCQLVTTLIKVVVWVVVTIVEVVYELVCKLVATIVRVVVEVLTWVVRTLSRLVCEVSALLGALFVGRLGYGLEDFTKGLGEIFQDSVETLTNLADDVIDSVISPFGIAGRPIAGLLKGLVQFIRSIGRGTGSLISGLGETLGRLLRFDFPGALESFVNGISDFSADAIQGIFRVWGTIFREAGEESIKEIAAKEIRQKFVENPTRVDNILTELGFWGSNFGFPIHAICYRLYLDSKNRDVWEWHNRGVLDLFALAHTGIPPVTDRPTQWWNQPRTELRNMDNALLPVGRGRIRQYVDSEGKEGGHFRIYAQDLASLRSKLNDNKMKLRELGLHLDFEIIDIEIKKESEFLFQSLKKFLNDRPELKYQGNESEICNRLPCVSAFYLDKKESCVPNSSTMPLGCGYELQLIPQKGTGGIVFRDRQPDLVFKWVPAHEIGHVFTLKHVPGAHRIMFSNAAGPWWHELLIPVYLLRGEPIFSLDEARKVWRYLVDKLPTCFPE